MYKSFLAAGITCYSLISVDIVSYPNAPRSIRDASSLEALFVYGESLAVLTAVLWAVSTILSAEALKKVDAIRANAVKTFFSSALMLLIAYVAGEMNNLTSVSIQGLLFVVAAAIVGFGIGDTLLNLSIRLVGVSQAYTFAYTSPLLTTVIAIVFLGEPSHFGTLIGTVLTVFSVILIATESTRQGQDESSSKGLLMAFGAAVAWAAGVTFVALGLKDTSVLLANALRYPVLSAFLFLISKPKEKWDLDKRSLMLLWGSGFFGMVLGGITFLYSMRLIGASRANPLSASSPVWASIMSSIFLKERVTARLLLSSVVMFFGIYSLTL